MRLNKIYRFLLNPFKHVLGKGYGHCYSCGFHWNIVDNHSINVTNYSGCFAVCEDCWNNKSDEEIIRSFNALYSDWKEGDKYNRPISVEDIGFTRQQMLEVLSKDLKERKSKNKKEEP